MTRTSQLSIDLLVRLVGVEVPFLLSEDTFLISTLELASDFPL
jgi:hypothetical protein